MMRRGLFHIGISIGSSVCNCRLRRAASPQCGLVAILISMLRQMEKHHYDQFMSAFADVTDQLYFITEILMVFKDLVSKCVYPPLWCEMIMLQNR